ncbi:coatomer delta subunit, putative [Trypanosoma equiperdum]|uniref:Coatomer subunit delta n=2 Tax=Trypanozoon TaxID=39700 RepID=Q57UJ7_TRYB2|nr:coatomer delta subunit, putative [Trypanosoma brucei brucei TREU927]AAX70733.1 coatomer delta subunit, putative [Trypanosoma brucei]AAZ13289.1 coatomer delta subunit, putative [Trypanosoma brucei brucei TREU927]SCU68849.1 coatomer delta subunit, putative [Trypanosoma equiperdum]
MTVIVAGIVNKQGGIVLSRHFNDITRVRVEGLLSAFPRLMEASTNKQVTYVDAGAVRYVYQPLDDLFLVLITTRSSNIVEDLDTLHLMGRLITEHVGTVSEVFLQEKAFKVFFALDEVIVGGRRENTTTEQIQTYLEMQSHEEMMVREEKRLQMERAKKDASRKAHELRDKRQRGLNPYTGIGSDSVGYGSGGAAVSVSRPAAEASSRIDTMDELGPTRIAGMASGSADSLSGRKVGRGGGLALGVARKADITSRVLQEAGLPVGAVATKLPVGDAGAAAKAPEFDGPIEGIHVVVEEKISATLDRDGASGPVDVRGELSVLVNDPHLANVKLMLSPTSDEFSFRAHAKVHKEIFAEDRVLAMRENKPFPVHQPVTILRWRLNNSSGVQPPLTFSCWPNAGSITVEYEISNADLVEQGLCDVRVTLPLRGAVAATVESTTGSCSTQEDCVVWQIPQVSNHVNASGNCEVVLADPDCAASGADEVFFPVDVTFKTRATAAHVRVLEVVQTENGVPVKFTQETQLTAEGYNVQ